MVNPVGVVLTFRVRHDEVGLVLKGQKVEVARADKGQIDILDA